MKTTQNTTANKFTAGSTYGGCGVYGDSKITITRRTEKTVWFDHYGESCRAKVKQEPRGEAVYFRAWAFTAYMP